MVLHLDGWLLLAHLSVTLIMTGIIWFVQIVHYPLFARVGEGHFAEYERQNTRRTGWVVAGPMLVELGLALTLAWRLGGGLVWGGLTLLVFIWGVTAFIQVPAHRRLERRFDLATHRNLVRSNWVRTVAWSARGIVALVMVAKMPT